MASVHGTVSPQSFLPSISKAKSKPNSSISKPQNFPASRFSVNPSFSKKKLAVVATKLSAEEFDVIAVQSDNITDQQEGLVASRVEMEGGDGELTTQANGFGANEGLLSLEGFPSSSGLVGNESEESMEKLLDRSINASIVLAAGTFALTKLLTIDSDYWHVSLNNSITFICNCVCLCVCFGFQEAEV